MMHRRLGTASRKARSRRRAADVSPALASLESREESALACEARERGAARPSGGCARHGRSVASAAATINLSGFLAATIYC
eukprot:1452180-Prymnesium_polylepis.1